MHDLLLSWLVFGCALTQDTPHCFAADAVWAVQWSATSEWVVITGGCDGAIRLWDVRRAGCFSILDHNKSWQVEKQHKVSGRRRTTPQRVMQVGDHLGFEHRLQSVWLSTVSMSLHVCVLGNFEQSLCTLESIVSGIEDPE